MCGRFVQHVKPELMQWQFDVKDMPDSVPPRYNIAPMTDALIIKNNGDVRVLYPYRWGLIPIWSHDESLASKLINARGETVATKPSFRAAFKKSRCIIPVNGFYEWQTRINNGKSFKQPYYFHPTEGEYLGLAGLTEHWVSAPDEVLHTFCIITINANQTMAPIHDRMPVILSPSDYQAWLDPSTPTADLQSLIRPLC